MKLIVFLVTHPLPPPRFSLPECLTPTRRQVYGEFDKDYSTWLDVVKVVAELDCLMSLSKSSQALGEPAVRPDIVESDQAIIEFEELRHPCVLR